MACSFTVHRFRHSEGASDLFVLAAVNAPPVWHVVRKGRKNKKEKNSTKVCAPVNHGHTEEREKFSLLVRQQLLCNEASTHDFLRL